MLHHKVCKRVTRSRSCNITGTSKLVCWERGRTRYIGYRWSNLGQAKYRRTKGTGTRLTDPTAIEVHSMEAQGLSRIVTRSNWLVIDQWDCLDHVCYFPDRRVLHLRVFDAVRIDSGSLEKLERTPELFRWWPELFRWRPEVVPGILKGSKYI